MLLTKPVPIKFYFIFCPKNGNLWKPKLLGYQYFSKQYQWVNDDRILIFGWTVRLNKTWKNNNLKTPENVSQARWTGSQSTLHLNSLHFPVLTYLLTFQAKARHRHLWAEGDTSANPIHLQQLYYRNFDPCITPSLGLFYWHWGIWGNFRQIRGNSPKREEALQHSISHLIEWRVDLNTGKNPAGYSAGKQTGGEVVFMRTQYVSQRHTTMLNMAIELQ